MNLETLGILACILMLIVAVVEINQWAHDIGIAETQNPYRWAKTFGFMLGLLSGVLITTMLMGGVL